MPTFYGAIDLSKNELRNAVVQNLGTAPATPSKGQIYFDSGTNILYWYNGSSWIPAMSGSALTPASTVTNTPIGTTAAVGTSPNYAREDHRHGNGTAIAALNMGGFQINALADPTAATDAANKQYVDNLAQGLSWKQAVRAYGAANLTLSGIPSNTLTDGVTLVAGDRVLVNNQTTPAQNGIYVAAAGAWARATDADTGAELVSATVYISEGTTYADTQWTCVTNAPITIGSTTISFQQISGAGTYTWGNGLTNVGNTVNVGAGTGIIVAADTVSLDTIFADNRYQPLDTDLNALANNATNGIWVRTGAGTGAARSIAGTLPITVSNGDGVAGNPTVAVNAFGTAQAGVVPASGGGTTNFLRADGTWAPATVAGAAAKFAAALTGTASPEVVTHNLNTRDVQVTVLNGGSPYTAVEVDWDATSVNTVTIRYNPNLGAGYRCVVVG